MDMDFLKINRKTLKLIPERKTGGPTSYKGLLILPAGTKHESGFMRIAVIGILESGELEVCAYPDDINWDFDKMEQPYPCTGMRTDCYWPNGLLHFWGRDIVFEVGDAFSSTEIKVFKKK